MPRDLDLGDRAKALEQLGVKPLAHATIVGLVKDVLPETQVGLLVASRPWPLLAAHMNRIREEGGPALLGAYLARLKDDTSFKEASGTAAVGRLVDAALNPLTTPPSERPAPAPPPPPPQQPPDSRPRTAGPDGGRGPRPPASRPDRPGVRGVRGDRGLVPRAVALVFEAVRAAALSGVHRAGWGLGLVVPWIGGDYGRRTAGRVEGKDA